MNNIQSPRTDDAGIEQLIQAKGKTAARVTPADISANIAEEHFFTARDGMSGASMRERTVRIGYDYEPLELLTFCVLVLKNGFTVTGESACASPKNFDYDIGKKIARENAINKIWPLLGFQLKSRIAAAADASPRMFVTKDQLREALATWERAEFLAADGADHLFELLAND